jgi:hypothetical protein
VRQAGTGWDGDRLAHNPEVAGSKSRPRCQGQRPFLERRKGLLYVVCARIANEAVTGVEESDPLIISSARVLAT